MRSTRTFLLGALALAGLTPSLAAAAPCGLRPACDAPFAAIQRQGFQTFGAKLYSRMGRPTHRGRDIFVRAGTAPIALAKFGYGLFDKDLEHELVDVYLLQGCGAAWQRLATVRTTRGGAVPSLPAYVGQPKDGGGRVYFRLPVLPVGRHRVKFVVRGDATTASLFIEVLPPNARVAVTDLDGTQTSGEMASLTQLVGINPKAHPGGAQLLTALAQRGYYIFYLTARPEWFVQRTRDWLRGKGYPEGILHTTFTSIGVNGAKAVEYKATELGRLSSASGLIPSFGFGNKASDVDAYKNAGLPMGNTYYFALGGDLKGGHRTDDYRTLLAPFSQLPSLCQ